MPLRVVMMLKWSFPLYGKISQTRNLNLKNPNPHRGTLKVANSAATNMKYINI